MSPMPKPSNSDLVGEVKSAWETFLQMPVDFDPLRDPNWQPDREDFRSFRDAAIARVGELAQQLEQAEQRERALTDWLMLNDFDPDIIIAAALTDPAPEQEKP